MRIGAGVWRTAPLDVYSHTTLTLEEGAVVSFIPDAGRYPPVQTRWEGVECFALHPLVFARDAEDIHITGRGTFDGNGAAWWNAYRAKKKALSARNGDGAGQPSGGGGRETMFLRPPLIQFLRCKNVTLEGVTVQNSPFWTIHPVYVEGLLLRDLVIRNPADAPNTDGIDVDSCTRVVIEGCRISVGDDGIALKSGSGIDGIRVGLPTRDVAVRRCTVENAHGGIVIGSETAGGIRDVVAEDCLFTGTDRGIRIKTRRGRGGAIRDITLRNLTMTDNLCPLAINMFYRCGADGQSGLFLQTPVPVTATTPSITGVTVTGVRASGCRASAGFVAGLPESPVTGLVLRDCVFETDETSTATPDQSDMYLGVPPVQEKSFRVLNARDSVFENVTVKGPDQAFIAR